MKRTIFACLVLGSLWTGSVVADGVFEARIMSGALRCAAEQIVASTTHGAAAGERNPAPPRLRPGSDGESRPGTIVTRCAAASTSTPANVIVAAMTKLLDQALEAVRLLPPSDRDEIARIIMQLTGSEVLAPVPLSPDEREAIARSKAAAGRGELATDEQVRAVWAKHGL